MKKLLVTTAFAALFAAPLLAQTAPGDATPHDSDTRRKRYGRHSPRQRRTWQRKEFGGLADLTIRSDAFPTSA